MEDYKKLVRNTYNKIVEKYSINERDREINDPNLRTFVTHLPLNGRILDIGCGDGGVEIFLTLAGFDVLAIDMSKEMIEYAKQLCPEASFEVIDMEELIFDDEEFNGIIARYSLIHLKKDRIDEMLVKTNKWLKKDGVFFCDMLKGDNGEVMEKEPYDKKLENFFAYYEKDEFEEKLKNKGFTIIEYSEGTEKEGKDEFAVMHFLCKK